MAMLSMSGYSVPMPASKAEIEPGTEWSLTLRQERMEFSQTYLCGAFLPFFFAVALSAVVASSIRLSELFGPHAG